MSTSAPADPAVLAVPASEAPAAHVGPRERRWRRGLLGLGVTFLTAGLCVLSYLAWEYYGSVLLAHHREHQVIVSLERRWHEGRSSDATSFGRADAIIEIPRFGPGYRVPVFEGTTDNILAVGYGHFIGAAGPGQVGNYALAAHRVTHSEPLRNMPELRVGDVIRVLTRTDTYVYKLTTNGDDLIVPLTAEWVTTPLPHNPVAGGIQPPQKPGEHLITLTTCAELFHTDNREIAFGVLVRTIPTT